MHRGDLKAINNAVIQTLEINDNSVAKGYRESNESLSVRLPFKVPAFQSDVDLTSHLNLMVQGTRISSTAYGTYVVLSTGGRTSILIWNLLVAQLPRFGGYCLYRTYSNSPKVSIVWSILTIKFRSGRNGNHETSKMLLQAGSDLPTGVD